MLHPQTSGVLFNNLFLLFMFFAFTFLVLHELKVQLAQRENSKPFLFLGGFLLFLIVLFHFSHFALMFFSGFFLSATRSCASAIAVRPTARSELVGTRRYSTIPPRYPQVHNYNECHAAIRVNKGITYVGASAYTV